MAKAHILTKEMPVKSKQYKYPLHMVLNIYNSCNQFNDDYFINLVHHFLSLDYSVVKYQV